jgi:hypothetical protein
MLHTRVAAAAIALGIAGCGGDDPPPRDAVDAVRQFYRAALVDGDAERACELLAAKAEADLTVDRPPPPCEEAIERIHDGLDDEAREEVERGVHTPRAFRPTRQPDGVVVVDVATRDSSGADHTVRRVDGDWQIDYIDPGAVDGGQPTADDTAIRKLHAPNR